MHLHYGCCLVNLLGNAIKYTPTQGQFILDITTLPTLGSNVTAQLGQQVQLVLEDSGPGIAATEYERVFDRSLPYRW